MPGPRVLTAFVLLAAALAARGGELVRFEGTLHLRTTSTRNVPSAAVLFDRDRETFDLDSYLLPEGSERHGSLFASMRLDGRTRGGALRWALQLDTGELRRTRRPMVSGVCLPPISPTGLAYVGSGHCGGATVVLPLEDTRLDQPILTSNGRTFRDEVKKTLLVREAWVAWSFGKAGFATLRAGRKRVTVGDGYVHDDYATAAELGLDVGAIGPPLDVALSVFQPTRDFPKTVEGLSPVVALRIDWLPSLFEHAGVFAAAFRDRTGSVGSLVQASIVEGQVGELARALGTPAEPQQAQLLARVLSSPLESDATLAWLGTSGSVVPLRRSRLGWTLAALGGNLASVAVPAGGPSMPRRLLAQDLPLRGRLASARWDVDVARRVTAGANVLYLSGGAPPRARGRYDAFLGITPYVTATNLFFGGGLSETFADRQATAPGVNGRGVVAPGLSLAFDPTDSVGLAAKGAWLRADVTGPFGGKVYGTEADLSVTWSPWKTVILAAELDVLWPGDFYAGRDTIYKTVVALDLVTP